MTPICTHRLASQEPDPVAAPVAMIESPPPPPSVEPFGLDSPLVTLSQLAQGPPVITLDAMNVIFPQPSIAYKPISQYSGLLAKAANLRNQALAAVEHINNTIQQSLLCEKKKTTSLFAHLHCYDISKFDEIYGEYIETICRYFNVVITYSIGMYIRRDQRFHVLKIPNKGMDIGAKFCMVQYLKDQQIDYSYILFLHSKSDPETRRKYFVPLLSHFENEKLANEFIENINNYDGYFPDIQWEIQGDKLKMISGNPQFANSNLPERNLENRKDLLDYLGCENRTNRFVEGNVYILSKKVVERLFGDKKLYNILNRPQDFDYNWVRKRYGLHGNIQEIYNEYKAKQLVPRDKLSYDGYIEHVFERVVLNVCEHNKYKLLGQPLELLNILIRNTYRPSYFPKCINSILNQTYKNFKVIMCYDDDNCLEYLDKYKNNPKIEIFKATEVDKSGQAFYNLYCNQLLDRVKKGWIMFLDDDDLLIDKNSLQDIANNLDNKDNMLFWKVKIAKHIIYPMDINNIKKCKISGIGFCFNSKYKNLARWDCERCSDYRFITKLLKNKKDFKRKCVNRILTGVQHTDKMGLLGRKEFPQSIKTMEEIIKDFDIKSIYTSKSLTHFNDRVCKKFNLTNNIKKANSLIFFGLYLKQDIDLLLSLTNSNIFLICGGSDMPNIQYIASIIPRITFIAISADMQYRFKKMNIPCTLVEFNLVDKELFYPRVQMHDYIYIYDGFTKNNPANEKIYGKKYYDEVVKRLPNEKFIFSSQLTAKYEEMPNIYAQCKIGLRLTKHDGNANTVQEFEAMNIPIIHNHSIYGLKWKSVDDIVKYIKKCNEKKIQGYSLQDRELILSEKLKKLKESDNSNVDFICYFSQYIIKTYISATINLNFAFINKFNIINLSDIEINDNMNDKLLHNFILSKKKNNRLIIDTASFHLLYEINNYKIFKFMQDYKIYNTYSECFLNIMDFHDYSMSEITGIKYSNYDHILKYPKIYKERIYWYISNNKLKLLSWCYSPEIQNFTETHKLPVYLSNMYLNYDSSIFKSQDKYNKIIDILSFGNIHKYIYKLRYSLYELFKKEDYITHRYNTSYDNLNLLNNTINSSWITIGCTSIYKYFVRKYIEIIQCNSVPMGDITNEGLYTIGHNFIYIDLNMSNEYILKKIEYYLSNKNILIDIIKEGKIQISKKLKEYNINMRNSSFLEEEYSNILIHNYRQIKIYDFIHVYNNFNKLDIINLDNLSSITLKNKIDILHNMDKLIIVLSDNNNFDLFIEKFYTNFVVIKTNNLKSISHYLQICKVCIYIETGYNYDENINILKESNVIVIIKNKLDNRYNNILYYNNICEIPILTNQIFKLNLTICNNENNYILIGVGSGQIDYGGIAVVCRKLFEFMSNLNYKVKLFLYGNGAKNKIISDNFYHNNIVSFYNDLNYNLNSQTKIILLNWLPNKELEYIKNLKNHSHFFVPGMIRDDINNWVNSLKLNKNDYHLQVIRTIQHVKSSSFCSILTKELYDKFNDEFNNKFNDKFNDKLIFYDNGIYQNYNNSNTNTNKIYDIGFIVSDFRRLIKNANMVYNIIKYFCSSDSISVKILLIGQNLDNNIVNIPKTNGSEIIYFSQLTNEECIEYISKTKTVLCTSFFDACPTVIYECMMGNTFFITSSNCGAIDHINKNYIVNDYTNINSWVNLINKLLNNSIDIKSFYNFQQNKLSLFTFDYLINGNYNILKKLT